MRDHYRYRLSGSGSTFQAFLWAPLCVTALLCLTFASCSSPRSEPRRTETELEPGWPKPNSKFQQVSLPAIRAAVPVVPGAEFVNDDELCLTCHKTTRRRSNRTFTAGFTRKVKPARPATVRPVDTWRPGARSRDCILNFKTMQPAQASEVCLKCHEENACAPGATVANVQARSRWAVLHWLATTHTTTCRRERRPRPSRAKWHVTSTVRPIQLASFQQPTDNRQPAVWTSNNLNAVAPGTCFKCHGDLQESDDDRRSAPDLRSQRLQLHDLPRFPRQDPGILAEGLVPAMPQTELAHDGLALVHAQPVWAWPAPTATTRIPARRWPSSHEPRASASCTPTSSIPAAGDVRTGARCLLQVPSQDLQSVRLALAPPGQGRQDDLLGLP